MPCSLEEASILNSLVGYLSQALKTEDISLTKQGSGDGRTNSSLDERKISQALRLYAHANERFKELEMSLDISRPRYWYDFLISSEKTKVWLPVNVKITAMKGQDNVSSKEGLYYALTGRKPEDESLNTWERYCTALSEHVDLEAKSDYYFLVVSKNSPGHVFWTSLKQLSHIVPNGNNPPFQCNWGENQTRIERPANEAARMLLETLGETFRLRAEAWHSFQRTLAPKLALLGG